MLEYSILQSVYHNDNASHLDLCLASINLANLKPKEIILVKDGLVSSDIEAVIQKWQNILPITFIGYEENQGLSTALMYGMSYVKTSLVARMDSDDIIYPDRFEKQVAFLENNPDVVLLSGYVDEFEFDENLIMDTKKVPLLHEDIVKYLRKRNAFNHMAVMFRKEAVLDAGGYQNVPFFEDYDLWIRIVQKGYKTANLSDRLVKARIGNDMVGRRHGVSYAKHEVDFFKRQRDNGFISKKEYRKLLAMRIPVRLLPKGCLKLIYKILRG